MKKTLENAQKLLEFAPKVGGVFSLSELSSLFNISSQQMLWIKIKQFEEADLLKRYSRGIYVTQNFDPMILSAKVRTDSYVSFGSALAFYKLIGTEILGLDTNGQWYDSIKNGGKPIKTPKMFR